MMHNIKNKEFKKWLKLSEIIKKHGSTYYVLKADLLSIEEMFNVWLREKLKNKK